MPSTEDTFAAALSAIEGDEAVDVGSQRISWSDYRSDERIFDNLLDIRGFTLVLDLAPLPELASREVASALATGMYGVVLKAIEEAGFFQEDNLTIRSDTATASVVYGDDRYDFAVQVSHSPEESRQGQLAITRSGSRFEDFHRWYAAIAGQFPEMVKGVLSLLRDTTGREIRAFRGGFQFRFLLYDLRVGDAGRPIRNSDVMRKLIRGVPDDDGALSESDNVVNSAGRIDVNLSRWVRLRDRWRLERYVIEAPANKEGAGLWLSFSYNGETYTLGDSRIRFDLDPFLSEGGGAYVTFLRDKALGRFLTSLLQDTTFRSSTDTLP